MVIRILGALAAIACSTTLLAEAKGPALIQLTSVDGPSVQVQFNPKEFTIDKQVVWKTSADAVTDEPVATYDGGAVGATLEFEVEFDRVREKGGVYLLDVAPLEKFSERDEKTMRPPMVLVTWGHDRTFKGVLESISVRYTMFSPDGTPVRATARVRVREAGRAESRGQCRNGDCPTGEVCNDPDGDGSGTCSAPAEQ